MTDSLMPDLLHNGFGWLSERRTESMARPVTIRRGASSVTVLATRGRSILENADETAAIIRIETRDFLVRPADYDFGDGPTLPQRGDIFEEVIDDTTHTFEVLPENGMPCWRWSNGSRATMRIHTKAISAEGGL